MKRLFLLLPLVAASGCVVRARPAVVEVQGPTVAVEEAPPTPVVEGAIAVDVLPPPAERVYVYDPGYPPGAYVWGGFVYYGGYRYHRDIFVHRFVEVNIRNHRYIDVGYNRRVGHQFEVRHREEFSHNHGHYVRHEEHHDEHHH